MSDKILISKKLFSKMVKQIETSSKLLEKYAEYNDKTFEKNVEKICNIMEKQGYFTKEEKSKALDDIKQNPTKIAQYVINFLDKSEPRPSLGQPSEYYSSTSSDPLYQFCFGSDI